jgi:hypothetical protein
MEDPWACAPPPTSRSPTEFLGVGADSCKNVWKAFGTSGGRFKIGFSRENAGEPMGYTYTRTRQAAFSSEWNSLLIRWFCSLKQWDKFVFLRQRDGPMLHKVTSKFWITVHVQVRNARNFQNSQRSIELIEQHKPQHNTPQHTTTHHSGHNQKDDDRFNHHLYRFHHGTSRTHVQ